MIKTKSKQTTTTEITTGRLVPAVASPLSVPVRALGQPTSVGMRFGLVASVAFGGLQPPSA